MLWLSLGLSIFTTLICAGYVRAIRKIYEKGRRNRAMRAQAETDLET